MQTLRIRACAGVLCVAGALPLAVRVARAQDVTAAAGDSVRAIRLPSAAAGPIRLDGLLTESVWSSAPSIGGLRQREPIEGEPATEATDVRILYDADVLYIGVMAHDRNPKGPIARILGRDRVMEAEFDGKPRFAGDDAVAILLDPFHDHRNAFVFATNANGAEFDALISDEGRGFNVDWRGVWSVAAKRTSDGWSAEFAIPFRTLRYPANPATWGFNVYRMIRRKNEEVLWRSWSRANEGFARVSRAGHLVGLANLPAPGLNADLKPYLVAGGDESHPENAARTRQRVGDVGLDFKSEVHPGVVLDLTYNTDFAQVEADDEQVNLTRFSLFFPEKREFFIENAGIFDFGAKANFEPPPFQLFFSRRIGINEDSGAVPLLGGGRLTGRMGRQTVGVLTALTGEQYGDPRTLFNVARLKRDVGSAGYVGAILVDRRSDSTWNSAGGLDVSFWPAPAFNVQGFLSHTATEGPGGEDIAYRVGTDYQSSRLGVTASHLTVGPDAEASAGFITRTNIRRTQGELRYTMRPSVLGLRRMNMDVWADHVADMDWVRQDWTVTAGIHPTWTTEDGIGVFATMGRNRITESFDLADTVRVDVGDYAYRTVSLFGSTAGSRPVVFDLNADLQEAYGGRVNRVGTGVTASVGMHLAFKVGYTYNTADLPNGSFTAHLVSLRTGYTFTTRLALNALLQYNSLDRDVSANLRLQFIHRPGSDIFVVLNEQRGSDVSAWDPKSRAVRLKVTYLARF